MSARLILLERGRAGAEIAKKGHFWMEIRLRVDSCSRLHISGIQNPVSMAASL
jgi:hypothetical protein